MKQLKSNMETTTLTEKKAFKGYTIDELEYQRAYLTLKKEFAKVKVLEDIDNLKGRKLLSFKSKGGKEDGLISVGSIFSKVMSGMNYLDYAVMAFSAFGAIKKFVKIFKKKK